MAAPVVVAAAAPVVTTPTVTMAAVASAKAAMAMLPGIAILVVGVAAIFKAVEIGEEKFDEYRIKNASRRIGAEYNKNDAYRRFLENRAAKQAAEGVRTVVSVPAPTNIPSAAQA